MGTTVVGSMLDLRLFRGLFGVDRVTADLSHGVVGKRFGRFRFPLVRVNALGQLIGGIVIHGFDDGLELWSYVLLGWFARSLPCVGLVLFVYFLGWQIGLWLPKLFGLKLLRKVGLVFASSFVMGLYRGLIGKGNSLGWLNCGYECSQ